MADAPHRWRSRCHAGGLLAEHLVAVLPPEVAAEGLVIGVPRGGIVVAAAVAHRLGRPLLSWCARKLAADVSPEYAIGAIAPGGVLLLHGDEARRLGMEGAALQRAIARESAELERRRSRYGDPPADVLRRRHLVVVDDGLATGLTIEAILQSLGQLSPASLRLAVPVADSTTIDRLRPLVDDLLVLRRVRALRSVGEWYDDFRPVDDATVIDLLARGRGATVLQAEA
ncbi:MAG: phosphoribosyltransferase [Prochlorococcaceae cyanobacterium]|jgi:putative phosphoribosyl transferase